MVQALVVRVDIGVVTYEDMTPQCGKLVVEVLYCLIRILLGKIYRKWCFSTC